MFFFFKKILKIFLLLINLFFSFFFIPFFLLKFFKEKKTFYLIHEGGFGHTITAPELLNYYFKNDWILIFAFSRRRHNKLIEKIYENKLFFFNVELINVSNEKINKLLFSYIYVILKYFFKKKVYLYVDKIKTLTINNVDLNFKIKYTDVERRIYYPVSNKINNQLSLPYYLRSKFETVLNKNQGPFKSKILFILRYKDFKQGKIWLRDSQSLEFYKDIILNLASNNFQIIFQGDLIKYPDWVRNLGKSAIFLEKSGLSKDEYGIFAGMISDVAIGPHSGAMYYTVAQKKKILLLDHFFLGDALPNSIVSYPRIFFDSFAHFKDLMLEYGFYNIKEYVAKYPSYQRLSSNETSTIILDFINNLNNKNYGVRPEEFGIKKGILVDCKAKFSPVWLKMVGL